MKRELRFTAICLLLVGICLSASAQNTAFTYQGRLKDGAAPANGMYDLQFILFNTNQFGFPVALILTNAAVPLNDGLFTATLDFGSGVFTGTNLWIEISVRTNGVGAFTTLAPRQSVTPAPYAITAENLVSVVENNMIQNGVLLATISGGSENIIQAEANIATIGGGQNNAIETNSFIATISGGANNRIGVNDDTSTISGGNQNIIQDGAGVSTIGGGVGNEIQSGSPRSTISGGSNNKIFNNAEHSFIGGGDGNLIQNGAYYSTIGGGLQNIIGTNAVYSGILAGWGNTNNAAYSLVAGGYYNTIQTNATFSGIAGGEQNSIQFNSQYCFIGGGIFNAIQSDAVASVIAAGNQNTIRSNSTYSAIGGGTRNTIQAYAYKSVIAGGESNVVQTNSTYSVIGGGYQNDIQPNAGASFIGGGLVNVIQNGATESTIGGGNGNSISGSVATVPGGYHNLANGFASAVGGGEGNTVSGFAATVPGGYSNVVNGNYSFAAGQQAQALHQGAFVWADSQTGTFSSTANDQFLVRAAGGLGINTSNPNGASLRAVGNRTGGWSSSVGVFENTSTASGSSPALRVVVDGGNAPDGALNVSDNGTGPIAEFGNGIGFVASVENDGTIKSKGVVLTSDRNAKENFTALDPKAVLEKVMGLPLTKWNYKDDSAQTKHIGPVAQDFHAAFGLNGPDDKHISIVDEGGVALAAIQGLNQKLTDELMRRDAENAELKQRIEALEKIMRQPKTKLSPNPGYSSND